MCKGHEKREYQRREKLYMAEVRVKQHKGRKRGSTGWDIVTLHNLSVGGTFFVYKKDLGIGTLLDLKIRGIETKRIINCVGKVIRAEQFQSTSMFYAAIEFDIGKKEKEAINANVEEAFEQVTQPSAA